MLYERSIRDSTHFSFIR